MSRPFMLNLSMALQTELANTGIRIQAVLPGATRTELWGKAGIDVAAMPANRLMDAGEMVDAALAGLDMGEAVTIPSLPEIAEWSRFNDARLAMGPNLSLAHAAGRYGKAA
jgi:short-subunit dehydrogenase